jgi:hypothetical protein
LVKEKNAVVSTKPPIVAIEARQKVVPEALDSFSLKWSSLLVYRRTPVVETTNK